MKANKIYYFTASWCSACRAMKPNFEKKMEEYPNVPYEYIDVESDLGVELSSQFAIRNIPTLVFLSDVENTHAKESGSNAYKEIEKYLS